MNESVVSYSTAEELKAAGFPQPTPQKGQTWYTGFRTPLVVETPEDENGKVSVLSEGKKSIALVGLFEDDYLFAPTVEFLKEELIKLKAATRHLGSDPEAFAKEWILINQG